MSIRRVARVIAWMIASSVLLVVGLYATLFAINWTDEAPSPSALAMQRLVLDRPAVADEDNAYVSFLGLAAPEHQDPLRFGQARMRFLERFKPSGAPSQGIADLPGTDVDYVASRPKPIAALSEACRHGDGACADLLRHDPAQVVRWLASEKWLLDRYLALVNLHQWRETIPNGPASAIPPYQHGVHAQQLLLMQAWQQARAGDGDSSRALLQRDLAFWRMVLRSSDLLITKMVATAAIERHFSIGNLVLRELHDAGVPADPPAIWRSPIDLKERSMQRTYAGETFYAAAGLDSPFQTDAERVRGFSIDGPLLRPLFKVQATKNLHATRMLRLANAVNVDYRDLPQATLAIAPAADGEPDLFHVYNPVGHILDQIWSYSGYVDYAVRVSDLEGTRRAALLAVELRAGSTEAAEVETQIRAAALKNPYSDDPFVWDSDTRSIVFNGLAPGDRARHAILL